MATRTGQIGNLYEYTSSGRRLVGTDRGTIDDMISLSRSWPETWHQYVGTNGYETWARAGREISETDLPAAIR